MDVQALAVPEVKLVTPRRFSDDRGWFAETWSRAKLAEAGIDLDFCQENQSLSRAVGTVRGLHFQTPPRAQDKLVRVTRGRIWDVAVDIRKASPTYGRWVAAEISAEAGNQILVPRGFAHGFCTLEPDTEVIYMVNDIYSKADDAGVLWNDPALAIAWPVRDAVLSDRDRDAPRLADIQNPF